MHEKSNQNCKNCRFLFKDECRRYAPRLAIPPVPGLSKYGAFKQRKAVAWPRVELDDWCGEFQEK